MNKEELEIILKEGEGQFIEFKENLDKRFAKEVVAFANAEGGRIFLGVSDDGEIKGIKITNELKSQIIDIGRNCDPSIKLDLEIFENVLVVNIPEGKDKPYQCKGGFFMRIGPNSQKLTRNQILKLSIKEGKVRFDEQICEDFDFEDFDEMKFRYYLKLSGITSNISRNEILKSMKVLTDKGMTNAGVLFFAKEPSKYISSSRVRCEHFNDNKRVEILDKKEVDLGIIGNIEFAFNYVKERVSVRYKIRGVKREEFPEFPEEAYREMIINAIVHRDYFGNREVAVEKLKNQVVTNNPGGLLSSFPKEEFGKLSYPRNKLLADLLSRTKFMERVGTGIKRIRDSCEMNKNKVEFRPSENYFFVEIFPSKEFEKIGEEKESGGLNVPEKSQKSPRKVPEKYQEIIELLKENPYLSRKEISLKLGMGEETIQSRLRKLVKDGLIERVGPDKGGYWEVLDGDDKRGVGDGA